MENIKESYGEEIEEERLENIHDIELSDEILNMIKSIESYDQNQTEIG